MTTTSNTKSTTRKSAAPRKSTAAGKTKTPRASTTTTAKPKHVPAPLPEQIYTAPTEPKAPAAPVFKMQELMAALVDKTDMKRAELRQTVGHVLDALGAALADGNDITLPGLGKITAKRREMKPGGEQIIARIKLIDASKKDTNLGTDSTG